MKKFEILTPIGFTVRTSDDYWNRLLGKHPDVENLLDWIQQTLTAPEIIRRSSQDSGVLLFYVKLKEERWMVTVVRRLNGDGFLITTYQNDAIKEGEKIWPN